MNVSNKQPAKGPGRLNLNENSIQNGNWCPSFSCLYTWRLQNGTNNSKCCCVYRCEAKREWQSICRNNGFQRQILWTENFVHTWATPLLGPWTSCWLGAPAIAFRPPLPRGGSNVWESVWTSSKINWLATVRLHLPGTATCPHRLLITRLCLKFHEDLAYYLSASLQISSPCNIHIASKSSLSYVPRKLRLLLTCNRAFLQYVAQYPRKNFSAKLKLMLPYS